MKINIIFLLLIASISQALAAGDPIRGKSKAILCIGCHGSDGNNSNPIYPKLAAQGAAYLAKQLTDFKSGARKEEHMSAMVEALNMSDIPHVAAYFSQQKRQVPSSNKADNETGKQIYKNGITSKDITACAGCHGSDGLGSPAIKFPSLAGQHTDYITKSLKDFRSGTRHNDPQNMMRNIATRLSDEEITAVANYISNIN